MVCRSMTCGSSSITSNITDIEAADSGNKVNPSADGNQWGSAGEQKTPEPESTGRGVWGDGVVGGPRFLRLSCEYLNVRSHRVELVFNREADRARAQDVF